MPNNNVDMMDDASVPKVNTVKCKDIRQLFAQQQYNNNRSTMMTQ